MIYDIRCQFIYIDDIINHPTQIENSETSTIFSNDI